MALALLGAKDIEYSYTFADSSGVQLYQYGKPLPPTIDQGTLLLLNGYRGSEQQNVARFNDTIDSLYNKVEIEFDLHIGYGGEGFGFALVNTENYTTTDSLKLPKWEEPSLSGSFAVGFDISNPPTSNIFDSNGNYYANPEREISLHWDGMEKKKILSPVEFRADPAEDEGFKHCELGIEYVIGGAEITLSIDDQKVFDSYFIASMQPYPFSLAAGVHTSQRTTNLYLDNVKLELSKQTKENIQPIKVTLIDKQPVYVKYRETSRQVEFPEFDVEIGRAILNLKIGDMSGGYDPWDEGAHIYLWQDEERYEICRFITPYYRGHLWQVDVTDFLPLFEGEKKIDLFVGTWMQEAEDPAMQKGWEITVDIDFYPGEAEFTPISVKNIWNGEFEYGNPADPLVSHLPQTDIIVPDNAKKAKLRLVVTGHGMTPNSQNAGEFMPSERTVYINQQPYENLLWKADCYLNSCRPQSGTWKFNRTGWAPGSVVEAWEIEINSELLTSGKLKLEYLPMAYLNVDESDAYKPHHIFESQLIFYK